MFAVNIFVTGLPGPIQLHYRKKDSAAETLKRVEILVYEDDSAPIPDDFGNVALVAGRAVIAVYMADIEGSTTAALEHNLIQARKQQVAQALAPKIVQVPS